MQKLVCGVESDYTTLLVCGLQLPQKSTHVRLWLSLCMCSQLLLATNESESDSCVADPIDPTSVRHHAIFSEQPGQLKAGGPLAANSALGDYFGII